jgi:cohesin complex subunit SA-1/2
MAISENDATNSPATENRRVSQRAVRAPEKFVPDAPSSRSGNANGKRKRGADDAVEDVENGAEDEDEEESEEEEEDESADEEETRQVKRRTKPNKKPVAKKAKVNGTAPSTSAPAVKLPTRQRKTKKVAIEDPNAEGLYGERAVTLHLSFFSLTFLAAEIFTSGDSSRKVAEEWLKRYQADNTASMTDLVNCILKSAGCDLKVTEDDVNDPDNIPSKLNDMQDEYRGVS